ncbi:MAG: hypothetical protein EXQ71_01350 [Acidimicrobiia bacterium]|nr:hypothetical protein [Acidimicrobiia bacterium]
MHPSNDYYGHEMILSWAASIHRPKRTFGYIQHGWKPESGFPADMRLIPKAPLFVWSEANRSATAARHPGHTVEAIGAPFLYLHELLKPALAIEPTKDLLVYPCHQLRSAPLAGEVHSTLIDQVRDLDPTSITVNLHPYEFDDGHTVALYQSELPDATVTTNWLRPPWVVSDDPTMLIRQILQMLDHRRVVSNCLTTAVLYASYLGRDARLLRHPERRQPPTEGRGRALHERLEQATNGTALAAIAASELGADHLRTPDELRAVLGWDSRWRGAAAGTVRLFGSIRNH